MRIAMMTNNYKPFIGGVPISIERLSEGLRELGHEVYIFAPTYKNQEEEPNVIRYKSFNKALEGGMVIPYLFDSDLEKKFKTLKIDLIHVHHPNFVGWMAQYLGKKYNVPVVYTYHTRYEQYLHHMKPFKKLEQLATNYSGAMRVIAKHILIYSKEKFVPTAIKHYANQCDGIFAPTHLMEDVLQEMGVATPIKVLPTGLNETFFNQDEEMIKAIHCQYKKDRKYLFCTVSRLNAEKNIGFLIDGVHALKGRLGSCFRVMIIGEGPQRAELEQKVVSLGLREEIVFIGNIENAKIKAFYAASDLFLFASKSETQGIVLLEAMAAKTPVVAIKASGVVEVVKNGMNGYMTGDTTDEWIEGVMESLKSPEHFEKLQKGAIMTAGDFTGESVAKRAITYYETMIKMYHYKSVKHKGEEQSYEQGYSYEEIYE